MRHALTSVLLVYAIICGATVLPSRASPDNQSDAPDDMFKQAFQRGHKLVLDHHPQNAVSELTRAMRIKQNFDVYFWRGRAYEQLAADSGKPGTEDYRKAIEDYQKALTMKPRAHDAMYHTAQCYSYINELENSAKYYRQVAAIWPQDTGAHAKLGAILLSMHDYKGAIEELNKHLALKPHDDGSRLSLSRAYIATGDIPKAIEGYDYIINVMKANDDDTYRLRADAYMKMRAYQKAIDDYSKAIALNGESSSLLKERAMAYRQVHREQLAKQDLEKAQKIEKEPAWKGL